MYTVSENKNFSEPTSTLYGAVQQKVPQTKHRVIQYNDVVQIHIKDIFSDDMIHNCQGKCQCYNCNRPIQGRICFRPLSLNAMEQIMVSPIPHCSPSCVMRSIKDGSYDAQDHMMLFYILYGKDVVCAPPRALLYLPGGLTLDQYHSHTFTAEELHQNVSLSPKYTIEVQSLQEKSMLFEKVHSESNTSTTPTNLLDEDVKMTDANEQYIQFPPLQF